MPDGIGHLLADINRKLLNIACLSNNKKIINIVNDLLYEDLPKIIQYIKEKNEKH